MKYVRLYADSDGVSHFEDIEVSTKSQNFAPPSPPAFISEPIATAQMLFNRLPAGWYGDWHPAPKRQYGILMDGELQVTAGDGETRTFKAGDVRLLEDTFGKGHQTKVIGDRDVLNAIVQLDKSDEI